MTTFDFPNDKKGSTWQPFYIEPMAQEHDSEYWHQGHTQVLTHWGRVTHICVSKLTIIGSDNGLSPGRRQAIILTNAGILLIRPLGTNFNEMLIEIVKFSFMKMRLKVSSAKWRPFCLGLNVLTKPARILGHEWIINLRICLAFTERPETNPVHPIGNSHICPETSTKTHHYYSVYKISYTAHYRDQTSNKPNTTCSNENHISYNMTVQIVILWCVKNL